MILLGYRTMWKDTVQYTLPTLPYNVTTYRTLDIGTLATLLHWYITYARVCVRIHVYVCACNTILRLITLNHSIAKIMFLIKIVIL